MEFEDPGQPYRSPRCVLPINLGHTEFGSARESQEALPVMLRNARRGICRIKRPSAASGIVTAAPWSAVRDRRNSHDHLNHHVSCMSLHVTRIEACSTEYFQILQRSNAGRVLAGEFGFRYDVNAIILHRSIAS